MAQARFYTLPVHMYLSQSYYFYLEHMTFNWNHLYFPRTTKFRLNLSWQLRSFELLVCAGADPALILGCIIGKKSSPIRGGGEKNSVHSSTIVLELSLNLIYYDYIMLCELLYYRIKIHAHYRLNFILLFLLQN